MIVSPDVRRELVMQRRQSLAMFAMTMIAIAVMTPNTLLVACALNATFWLVRIWYFTSMTREIDLIDDRR